MTTLGNHIPAARNRHGACFTAGEREYVLGTFKISRRVVDVGVHKGEGR
jgi:hypothetical protein